LKTAVPISEDCGIDSPVSENFLLAPYFVVLTRKEGEVEVNLYKNVAMSDREVAEVLLAYGVKRVVYPKASNRVKVAFNELGLEVLSEEFETLKDVLERLF